MTACTVQQGACAAAPTNQSKTCLQGAELLTQVNEKTDARQQETITETEESSLWIFHLFVSLLLQIDRKCLSDVALKI